MNTEQIAKLYENMMRLTAAGKEAEARALLIGSLPRLPEELQAEIMIEMYTESLEKEEAGLRLKREIQEDGLAAAKVLQAIQKSLSR